MTTVTHALIATLLAVQAAAAARLTWRLIRSARGQKVRSSPNTMNPGCVTVIIPTLNEEDRLPPCLEGAMQQGEEVASIIVVDGGSTDGTQRVVESYAARDPRIRWCSAAPIPNDWNGKAWGLEVGRQQADDQAPWILTLDADTQPQADLSRSLVAHAMDHGLDTLSIATRQQLESIGEGLVHPALLASLVYRFGIPGQVARGAADAQANGQCMLLRREALEAVNGFQEVRASRCEDVTLARILAARGFQVGFAESDGLIHVRMYESGWETVQGWTRSLPLRDAIIGGRWALGLTEVTLAQALPLWIVLAGLLSGRGVRIDQAKTEPSSTSRLLKGLRLVNGFLLLMRIGLLAGMSRAYLKRPWTYWLSPLMDGPMTMTLWFSAVRPRQRWRGRDLVEVTT